MKPPPPTTLRQLWSSMGFSQRELAARVGAPEAALSAERPRRGISGRSAEGRALLLAQPARLWATAPMPLGEGLRQQAAFAGRSGAARAWTFVCDELEGNVNELNRELVA